MKDIDIVLSILIGSMAAIMAVVGGVVATEKRFIKKLFVFMGIASVILIAVQSVRLSRIQKKRDEVQAELLHGQNKLVESFTGGDSVPFVILFPDFQHPGKVAFILKNRKCQSKHTVDRLNPQPSVRSGRITA